MAAPKERLRPQCVHSRPRWSTWMRSDRRLLQATAILCVSMAVLSRLVGFSRSFIAVVGSQSMRLRSCLADRHVELLTARPRERFADTRLRRGAVLQKAVGYAQDEGILVEATRKPSFRWWPLPIDPALTAMGDCLHVPEFCSAREDRTLLKALAADVERCEPGAVGKHRSGKHLVVYGEALRHSRAFRALMGQIVSAFDVTMVDCWVNVYRGAADMKSFHRDNYRDRVPRPTLTLGISLGETRDLAFKHMDTNEEYRITQGNGDLFAFDHPFNMKYQHSVPPAQRGGKPKTFSADDTDGLRLSVIVWANKGTPEQRVTRKPTKGWRPQVPLDVTWEHFALQDIDLPTALAEKDAVAAAHVDPKPSNSKSSGAGTLDLSGDVEVRQVEETSSGAADEIQTTVLDLSDAAAMDGPSPLQDAVEERVLPEMQEAKVQSSLAQRAAAAAQRASEAAAAARTQKTELESGDAQTRYPWKVPPTPSPPAAPPPAAAPAGPPATPGSLWSAAFGGKGGFR